MFIAMNRFMVSFGSVTRAVECAVALQSAFAERAGEPIEETDDLFGTAVTMAARIMGRATGGEILVSDLVRGAMGDAAFLSSRDAGAALSYQAAGELARGLIHARDELRGLSRL